MSVNRLFDTEERRPKQLDSGCFVSLPFIQALVWDTDMLSWDLLTGFVAIFEYKFDMAIVYPLVSFSFFADDTTTRLERDRHLLCLLRSGVLSLLFLSERLSYWRTPTCSAISRVVSDYRTKLTFLPHTGFCVFFLWCFLLIGFNSQNFIRPTLL